ncbi:lysine--tRNA ligase [Candidatus Gracilibacteria bacterium HOT-871]|nr:lysine--tRNA ligase [Candidatus Gracilibacteria bacterium HOT-871]
MEYSREALDRIAKIKALKEAGVICYADKFEGKQDISDIIKIKELNKSEDLMENGAKGQVKTAGRLVLSRGMGKLLFGKIIDNSGAIQILFKKDSVLFNTGKEIVENIKIDGEEKSAFKVAEKLVQMGDYIGVIGDLFLTKHGELTIFVKEFQILSKAVRPLPEKFHGISDIETVYRQRYLDLITNEESFERFKLRSKFVKTLRDFYFENNFIEIETPVLGNAASGAAAKPFITHHENFDEDFFLRISPETFLKRATVGRFERVVEFTRDFRNEGSDPSHMQEFCAIEHYACWWNYEDNMRFTENMFDYIFEKIPELKKEIEIKDKSGNARMVNFQTPWQRVDYIKGVYKACGIDVSKYLPEDEAKLRQDIKNAGFTWEGIDIQATATMIDYLYKKVLRPNIVGPAFVYNYPKTMQPLARQNDENPLIVEQFQLVANGWEIVKAYSELVDPEIQKANFDAQGDALDRGDEEATSGDDDFVLAMEYGMPPQSGWGMGIERILSILTAQENLRDVFLFPLMKSGRKGDGEQEKN